MAREESPKVPRLAVSGEEESSPPAAPNHEARAHQSGYLTSSVEENGKHNLNCSRCPGERLDTGLRSPPALVTGDSFTGRRAADRAARAVRSRRTALALACHFPNRNPSPAHGAQHKASINRRLFCSHLAEVRFNTAALGNTNTRVKFSLNNTSWEPNINKAQSQHPLFQSFETQLSPYGL